MARKEQYIHCRADDRTKRRLKELSECNGLTDSAYLTMVIAKEYRSEKQREYRRNKIARNSIDSENTTV